jgi:ComF family protein
LSNPPSLEFDSRAASSSLRGVCLRALRGCLPQACALCRAGCGNALLCPACAGALPALGPACSRCALPAGEALCGACLRRAPPWVRACAAWRYAYPVDRLLQALKYGGRIALAEPLADGLAATIAQRADALPDAIVPLPLARSRQRARGFDQARLIALRVGRQLRLPVVNALSRVRDSGPQAALPLAARAANVRDAFAAGSAIAGARIAIVDDVMTTGATLAAATHAALRAHAAAVDVWVVARTLPPSR